MTQSEQKLSTALLLVTKSSSDSSARNQQVSGSGLITKTLPASVTSATRNVMPEKVPSGNLVYVYISTQPGYSTHIADSLVADVTDRDENNHLAVGWVDIQNLLTIASLDGVRNIREVIPPVVRMGSVTTQGDAIHKTANVRSMFGYNGSGVKIGIISDGVDHIADSKATGDLPSNVHVLSNTRGGDEGTAMLEIVYDMVPEADLYFHDCGSNTVAFNAAIDELKANGCTVICDDIGWITQPFFEDGSIATHISSVLSSNQIVYISSAGNAAQKHYQGEFYSNAGTNWTDFSSGTDATYKSLYLSLPAGSSVRIVLEWNDQFGYSGNDYDLYLSKTTMGDLGYSIDRQTGTGDPLESISYTNTGSTTIEGKIDVYKYSGASKTLELYIYPRDRASVYTNNIVISDSVFGHPAVPDVIAAAAVYQGTPTIIESFSSRGPVTITYPSAVSRLKPDISGVDGVSVTGAGGFSNPFYGTSAAAPHIAAVVAQIWGAHPTLTPAQVRSALYTSAVVLGTTGRDTTFGYGRADALAMVNITATSAPTVTGISPASGTTNGGTPVTITGTNFLGATAVKFGTTAATGVNVVSATSITASSPAQATGIVDVTVTTPSGTSAISTADKFTYVSTATNGSVIEQSATIFIGESGLNVADALNVAQGLPIGSTPSHTQIGWWESAAMIRFTPPTKSIDLVNRYQSMEVAPADFVGYTG
ncbi:MAG: S8 family serine peptidase, partial [Methanomicrobiales archaeon]